MAKLRLEHIYKVYDGRVKAVNDLDMTIDDKDFIVFVGPSGCGKSTTLRMIAGLEEITSGQLYIDDVLVNEMAPKDRDIAMVFQNYALYPHKTVYENMAFGLKLAGLKSEEIKQRIEKVSDILELTPYLTRKPKALSGGQKQRVALGRSIVREPKVFLFDEPLSNLDAKLRVQMRSEITKLHRRLGTTFIYVTHDQVEAMTMGSRIFVMKDGFVQQIDSPTNLYDHPDNIFVATFLGTPQMNTYEAMIVENDGHHYLTLEEMKDFKLEISPIIIKKLISNKYIGQKVIFGIRPEDVFEVKEDQGTAIRMLVEIQEKRGSEIIVYGVIENTKLAISAKLDGRRSVREGDIISLGFSAERIHLFDFASQKRIAEVITYDYLPGIIDHVQKTVGFAGKKILLSDKEYDSVLPEYKNQDAKIGVKISTDAFSLTRQNDSDVEIKAIIKTIEVDKNKAVLFVEIKNNDNYICVKLPAGDYQLEDKLTLFIDSTKIQLFDESFSLKITALHPITNNTTICEVKTKNGASFAQFGEFTLEVDKKMEPGKYQITIPYDQFEIVENKKNAIKNRTMKFKCVNESVQGENMILYANLKEFSDYISIRAGKAATCFTKGKITFNIKHFDLTKID